MMSSTIFYVLLMMVSTSIIYSEAKAIIIVDQKIEDCTNATDRATIFDFTGMDLVPVNDTHTFMNGTWKFNQDLVSPWIASCVTERYVRGQWLMQAFNRNYKDLCKSWHSPLEPFYGVTKKLPGCPVKAGTVWNVDMQPIVFDKSLLKSIPPHYAGRWRGVMGGEFKTHEGKTVKECKRVYFDIFED